MDKEANILVGQTLMTLSGDKEDCRFSECAFGDLIAEIIAKYFIISNYEKSGDNFKTYGAS